MFDFSKVCRTYEAMNADELKSMLQHEAATVLEALAELGRDGVNEFILFVMTACGADGKLDPKEYALFCDVTGISYEYDTVCELVCVAAAKDSRHVVDIIADAFGQLSDEIKASIVSFCLCFCAANGKISGREKRFIKKLLK